MADLDEAFSVLNSFADAGDAAGVDVDPMVFLEAEPEEPEQTFPGEGEEIDLSSDEREELARALCEELDAYDAAMAARHDRWDEIEDAYDLASTGQGGEVGESEAITSEWLMSVVDQATARIEEALLGADPLVRVKPLVGEGDDETAQWADDAKSAENVLNNYVRRESGFDNLLPVMLHRTVKLGTAVARIGWVRRKWVSRWYDSDGEEQVEDQESAGVEFEMLENHAVVVWPPDLLDWQKAELVGHRAVYTHYKWQAKAREWDLDSEVIAQVETVEHQEENRPGEMPDSLSTENVPKQITELWCDMPLPGEDESSRFQVLIHEPTKTLLKIFPNRHREQQHPYYPLRYKLPDLTAWGDGIGDEGLTSQSIDSALRTMEMDNLMAGAYWVNWVKAGSTTDMNLDRLRPGEVLRGDNPDEFKPIKMGGDAPEIGASLEKNRFYGREGTGMASVLSGQGDPTMKSGAGTGSTLALIEQASSKFNAVGRRIKFDLAPMFGFVLELLGQFVTEEQLYKIATRRDAEPIEMLKWQPPRRRIRDVFHVEVEAPSASTSYEARKQSYLMLWTFCMQFVQTMIQTGGPALQQSNPQGYMRWLQEWADFMTVLARRIVEHHDLPGMKEKIPKLPEMTPQDQQIMQLEGEIQQLTQQLQQMQMMMGPPDQGQMGPQQPMGPQGVVQGGMPNG